MADPDQHQNATLPVAFNRFIEVMNMDQAKDLVRSINTFMKEFKQQTPNPELDSQAVQAFLQQMETAMAKHPLFASSSPQEQDAATEALEKYLMTKLHERTFRQSPDDVERDELLAIRCAALQFVEPSHLEIPDGIVDEVALGRAAAELNKINNYKAPRDKLVCILNCCRMLNSMLTSRSKAEGIGADDFTPLLIYLVIRARPPALASNLAYIERYRYHAKLTSETQYYFIQLCSSATFIEMMDATSLKVNPDEFIAHMLAAGAMSDEQLAMMQSTTSSMDGAASPHSPSTRAGVSKSTARSADQAAAAGIREPAGSWQQHQQYAAAEALQMQPLPTASPASSRGNAVDVWGQPAPLPPPPTQQQQTYSYGQQQHLQQPYQQQQHYQPYQQQQYYQPPAVNRTQPQQQHQYQQQQQQQHYQYQQPQRILVPAPLPSIAELEAQGAALLAAKAASVPRQLASRHPLSCSSLESLSLGDVGKLLTGYKELVLRHEALTAALEQRQQQSQQQYQQLGQQLQTAVGQWVPPPPTNPPPPAPVASAAPAPAAAATASAAPPPAQEAAAVPTATVAPVPPPPGADASSAAAPAELGSAVQVAAKATAVAEEITAQAAAAVTGNVHTAVQSEDDELAALAAELAAPTAAPAPVLDVSQQPAADNTTSTPVTGQDVAAAESQIPAAQQHQPDEATTAAGVPPAAPAAAVVDSEPAAVADAPQSQVDALLDSLLDGEQQQQQQPVSAVDVAGDFLTEFGTASTVADAAVLTIVPTATDTAGAAAVHAAAAAAAADDDLFSGLQQPSDSAAASSVSGQAAAPSLLD